MMDDFEPDYEPIEGEIPEPRSTIRGSSKRKSKVQSCPICQGRFTNVRRHVICSHLPWYTSPLTACWTCKLQLAQEKLVQVHMVNIHNSQEEQHKFDTLQHGKRWTYLMNGLLDDIAKRIPVKFEGLIKFVQKHSDFSICSGGVHHWSDMPLLKLFNEVNIYKPSHLLHSAYPPTDPHSLLHWKILALLIAHTESGENLVTFERELELHPTQRTKHLVSLVDSHFHLDLYLKETRHSGLPSLTWDETDRHVEIQFLISNYCFPRNWPSSKDRHQLRKDKRLMFTFGIHPRMVARETRRQMESWLSDLEVLVEAKNVCAIGECGLDAQQASERDISRQMEVLDSQLQLAKAKQLPVVIHCRGLSGEDSTDDRCLDVMRKVLEKDHRIHRHCFGGNIGMYRKWKSYFPNCKFGISPFLLMEEKYPDIRSTVCNMDINDIIIETDAPYLSNKGGRTGCPSMTYDIAQKLANLFNVSLMEVACVTTSNALKLYNIKH
ncbi:putative deoxyribonuclease TATDN2 [Mytilus trossulus]|uniref:putative deoxyribonuclease TATDN2 n=1 Tax=Mytilus trossulus TaxID=6551 RepID=UPI0030055DF3